VPAFQGVAVGRPERTPPEPLSSKTRHVVIQEHLRQYIIANRLKPGDYLPPEEVLVEQLGVSRSALREALRSMETLGIIATQHGVGRVVLPFRFTPLLQSLSYGFMFDKQDVIQITEIRKALDAYFIEHAIHRISEAELNTLSELVEQMQARVEQGEDFEREDYEFHRVLYACCGNELAYQLFDVTWKARRATENKTVYFKESPPGTHQMHRELLDAIIAKDVERSRQLIIAHHGNFDRRFRETP
jgi:DNA-binding FadR family transcriptional regulator